MSLVQYPESGSESDDHGPKERSDSKQKPLPKRKHDEAESSTEAQLPPLPAAFHDLYAANARTGTSDDPSLHGGRKRAVPHVQGNWPSHVYLEWVPSQTDSKLLLELINELRTVINASDSRLQSAPDIVPSLLSELGAPLPLHISLSQTLQVKTANREIFVDSLSSSLRKAAVPPFEIKFTRLNWVPNFDRTRWFIVLCIAKPEQDQLNRLLHACNDAAISCGHAALYAGGEGDGPMEASEADRESNNRRSMTAQNAVKLSIPVKFVDRSAHFHVSIAWTLQEAAQEHVVAAQDLDISRYTDKTSVLFDVVKARVGNSVTNIALKKGNGMRSS